MPPELGRPAEMVSPGKLFDLTGSAAIVTGASTGLGKAMTLALAAAGADILLVDHTSRHEVVKEVQSMGRNAVPLVADLQKMDAVEQIVCEGMKQFGKIDILVNNAGIIRRTPAVDYSEKDWDETLMVNAKSVFFLSQRVAKEMMKKKYGKIINVASLLSFQGGILVSAYAASKGAVGQLTKALANEWAPFGIAVNAIAPGYMETKNTDALRSDPVRSKSIRERIPAGRWGVPEDLQGAVVFLASHASDYVNGHVLAVDGGWLAR